MGKRTQIRCPWCTKPIAVTADHVLYQHNNWSGLACKGSRKGLVAQTLKMRLDEHVTRIHQSISDC